MKQQLLNWSHKPPSTRVALSQAWNLPVLTPVSPAVDRCTAHTHTIVLIADGQTRQTLCVTKGPYRKGFSWSRALGLSLLSLKVMGQFTTPSLHRRWKEVIGSDESEPEEQHHQQAHGLLTETVIFMCSCEHATHEHKPEINYSATYWEKCGAMVKSLYHTRTVWLPYLHFTVIKCFCKIILQE